MSVGDILQETLRLYAKDWPVYLAVVATIQIPLGVATVAVLLATGFHIPKAVDLRFLNEAVGGLILLSITIVLNVLLTVSAVYGATAKAVHQRCCGMRPTFGWAMSFGWGKFFALLGASVLVGLALALVGLPALTCVGAVVALPAMAYLTIKWLFFAQAIILDDFGAVSSLRYSWRLVDGLFRRSLGICLLLTGISIGLVSVPTNILGLLIFVPGLPASFLTMIFVAASVVLTIVATPIQMIGLTLAYYDVKARNGLVTP